MLIQPKILPMTFSENFYHSPAFPHSHFIPFAFRAAPDIICFYRRRSYHTFSRIPPSQAHELLGWVTIFPFEGTQTNGCRMLHDDINFKEEQKLATLLMPRPHVTSCFNRRISACLSPTSPNRAWQLGASTRATASLFRRSIARHARLSTKNHYLLRRQR